MRPILSILLFAAGAAVLCPGQVSLTPWTNIQYTDQSGRALSAGKVYTCVAGASCPGNPQPTYTTSSGGTAHQNPITLDSSGRPPGGQIWLTSSAAYKIVVTNAAGAVMTGAGGDNISGATGGGGGGGGNNWTLTGANIFNSNSGAVGIGTSTPAFKLEVNGDILSNSQLILRTNEATLKYGAFKAPATIGTSYVMTIPSDLPGAIGCMKLSPTGVISVDAACATGPTDTIWSVDMDNNVTLADSMTTVSSLQIRNQTTGTGVSTFIIVQGDGQGSGLPAFRFRNPDANPDLLYIAGNGDLVTRKTIGIIHPDSTQPVLSLGANGFWAFALFGETDDSVFHIARYDNTTGVFIDSPYTLNRVTGDSYFLHTLNVTDAVCSGTCTGFGGGGSGPPFSDVGSLVYKNGDATASIILSAINVSPSSVRALKAQDATYTIAGLELAQTFLSTNNFRDIEPSTTETYRLGSARRWYEINVNRINGICPSGPFCSYNENYLSTRKLNIHDNSGTADGFWNAQASVITGINSRLFFTDSGGTERLSLTSVFGGVTVNQAQFTMSAIPTTTNTWDLGTSSLRWRKLWVTDIDVSGVCTGCGAGGGGANTALSNLGAVAVNQSLIAGTHNAINLGSTSIQWNSSYVNRMWSCDSSTLSDCWRIQAAGASTASTLGIYSPTGTGLLTLQAIGRLSYLGTSSGALFPLSIVDTGNGPGINFYRSSGIKAGSILAGIDSPFNVLNQSDASIFTTFQSGNVQIGNTTDQGYKLYVNGQGYVNGQLRINGTTYIQGVQLNLQGSSVIAPSGLFGASATFNCTTSGQAIKSITVSGGIVTGATCAAP